MVSDKIQVLNGKSFGWVGISGMKRWLNYDDNNKCYLAYVGRGNIAAELRGSPLYNPYIIGEDGDRSECIQKFRRMLWEDIKLGIPALDADKSSRRYWRRRTRMFDAFVRVAELVASGAEVKLVCWCSPKPCHGDVLVKAIAWFIESGYVKDNRDNQ